MQTWKENLIVCWFGIFIASIGMTQIAPVLPLYIKHMGVNNPALIAQYSGFAFGVTFIISAIFSPIWGHAADIYGRKPMILRASFGMSVIIFLMGFANNVYAFIGLRLLQGTITGYSTACVTLIAAKTDKKHAGWALGTLSTSGIAGSLLGPMIGGFIGDNFGLQNVFFITGGLLFISFIISAIFIKESFVRENKKTFSIKEIWGRVPEKSLTITLFVTSFVLSAALCSVEPIITVYITQLTRNSAHIALLAGTIFSATGLGNIIAAPSLGKLSDKIGPHKVMFICLLIAGILFIPQAFVTNPWQLMELRFLLGLTVGGLAPSVNSLIKRITPNSITGRVFGFSMSSMYLGLFAGAVLGGQAAAWMGIRYVFFCTSALLLMNAVWVYFKVHKIMTVKKLSLVERLKIKDYY